MFADHVTDMTDLIPKDGSSFDIQLLFFNLTLTSATKFLFGESIDVINPNTMKGSTTRDGPAFGDAFDSAQDYLAARGRAQSLYWLINPPAFREAVHHVHRVIDQYVKAAIERGYLGRGCR